MPTKTSKETAGKAKSNKPETREEPAKKKPEAEKAPAKAAAAPPPAPAAATEAAEGDGGDVAGADAGYARVEARLRELPDDKLQRPTVDAQQAALAALAADERLRDPARRATIEALAKLGLVKLPLLDGMKDLALATWHARHKLLEVSATETRATLSADLRGQATDCRKRMRLALEYNVRDAASVDVLRYLRSGRGDLDLSNDLLGYARLYRERRVDLERDKVNYRPSDEALAKRLAGEIGKRLASAETPEARAWIRAQHAAFTLLLEHHAEAARVGRFLERDDDAAVYPSLFAASRTTTVRHHAAPAAAAAPPA